MAQSLKYSNNINKKLYFLIVVFASFQGSGHCKIYLPHPRNLIFAPFPKNQESNKIVTNLNKIELACTINYKLCALYNFYFCIFILGWT